MLCQRSTNVVISIMPEKKNDIVDNNDFDLASLSEFERLRLLNATGMLIDFLISQLGDDEIRAFGVIHRNDEGTKAPIKFLGE